MKTEINQLLDGAAQDSMGIHCAGVTDKNGVFTPRGDYGNGWNASYSNEPLDNTSEEWIRGYNAQTTEVTRRKQVCRDWFNSLSEETKQLLPNLLDNGTLWLHFDGDQVTMEVNCNDLFYWGCADSEDITIEELPALAREGSTLWCCKKRNLRPQVPIVKRMKESGEWTEEFEAFPAPHPS